jgi:hypothetical protein
VAGIAAVPVIDLEDAPPLAPQAWHGAEGSQSMQTSILVATTACGVFFLAALLTGTWKWRLMLASSDHLAPPYVDTAHRASLMYSFACLVLIHFLELSPLPEWANVVAASLPLAFFAIAIASYIQLGLVNETDNQFAERSFGNTIGITVLAVSEIGGFAVLFGAFLVSQSG